MTAQEFSVLDVMRLQVQEGWPDLPNQILNPSGEGGAWGWETKPGLVVRSAPAGLRVLKYAAGANYARSAAVDVAAVTEVGTQARGAVSIVFDTTIPTSFQFRAYDVDGSLLDVSTAEGPFTLAGDYELPAWNVPVGTTSLRFYVLVGASAGAGEAVTWRDTVLMVGEAADIAASDPLSEPEWVDVLGSAAAITVERDELNVGTLEATLFDATLDPASTDLIRPGKRCRWDVLVAEEWEPLFTGKLENPSSAYEVRDDRLSDLKRVKIRLVASDAAADLANDPRPEGVATMAELPYVLAGTGVPFNVNGSDDAIDPDGVVIVSRNDQASALDQVAVTRDSVLGFAWIDRAGVLQAWDRGELLAGVTLELAEEQYSDVDVDFDVDRTFNTLRISLLQINPGTDETEEIPYGPYVDHEARREWRAREATFKIHGVDPDLIDEFAAEILALNAQPVKRINSVTMPIRTVDEIEELALCDLYDLISVSNDRGGVEGQESRITSIKHRVVVKREGEHLTNRWWVDLDFSTDGSVASPQVTPSPTAGGGRTVAQLLEPVGKVSLWFGAKADIPAGWLPLDGSAFAADTYPELAALLGGAVLPDMTDRFPIGAGTKALGASGGSVTTDEPTDAGVGWAVDNSGGSTAARLSEFNAHTHDVIPPWRALWFIIRAA